MRKNPALVLRPVIVLTGLFRVKTPRRRATWRTAHFPCESIVKAGSVSVKRGEGFLCYTSRGHRHSWSQTPTDGLRPPFPCRTVRIHVRRSVRCGLEEGDIFLLYAHRNGLAKRTSICNPRPPVCALRSPLDCEAPTCSRSKDIGDLCSFGAARVDFYLTIYELSYNARRRIES